MRVSWIVIAFAVLDYTSLLVKADGKVCSSTCSSVGTSATNAGNLVMISIKSTKIAGVYLETTGLKLLMVCIKSTVTWS